MYVFVLKLFLLYCVRGDVIVQNQTVTEKWLNSLEVRLADLTATLAKIDANVDNLQERAHAWGNFQLHVAAWNEQLATLDRKIDILNKGQDEFLRIEARLSSLEKLEYKVDKVLEKIFEKGECKSLFEDFTLRGVLSTVKAIEKRLNNSQQSCLSEELLRDISSKVDIIFDVSKESNELEENDVSFEIKSLKRVKRQCKKIMEPVREILERTFVLDNATRRILEKQLELEKVLGAVQNAPLNKTGCGNFSENSSKSVANKTSSDKLWTVIQRRQNRLNFNLSWAAYKSGFGTPDGDFWIGNDFLSAFSAKNRLTLRIELEDFDGNKAWAEYEDFQVLPEEDNYRLIISGYKGNASDSFSSHNGSLFSTFDAKNDQAPECCPCAVSYGGGWWFNRCFESNLNGPYVEQRDYKGGYVGIIWETWLGNYSLKKTLMMVRISQVYVEDP